ncbi:MAG: hypothetical protein IPL65_07500 [Lewinellaceae bacterium]|nr:hypothetical protein [Lewinellaceae bacterium]
MKKLLLLLPCLLLLTFSLEAQTSAPRELGVRFDNINFGGYNSFSLVYKKAKSENRYARWRASFGNLNLQVYPDSDAASFGLGFGLRYGLEKRKALSDKFSFCRGPEFGGGFNLQAQNEDVLVDLNLGFGYILGLQYDINRIFFLNLETIPGVGVNIAAPSEVRDGSFGLNAGFISSAVVTVGMKF